MTPESPSVRYSMLKLLSLRRQRSEANTSKRLLQSLAAQPLPAQRSRRRRVGVPPASQGRASSRPPASHPLARSIDAPLLRPRTRVSSLARACEPDTSRTSRIPLMPAAE
ncbi:hypothetical protein DM56_4813 [Burkholderia mallei]|nr:hypothetical protein DM45_4059 [Burkholderia mallei]KOT12011.1 hypothetical protein DM56_4813 [Burkholderia mallei]